MVTWFSSWFWYSCCPMRYPPTKSMAQATAPGIRLLFQGDRRISTGHNGQKMITGYRNQYW